jgi:acetylglutamate kinase
MDVHFMQSVGIHPVIVHGGGKAISRAMEDRGLEVQFVQGRRYTDSRAITVVEHVLCNEVNSNIVEILKSMDCDAMGLHTLSSCVLTAEKTFLNEGGRKIDLGLVGHITEVNSKMIRLLCESSTIPVIAPLAKDPAGKKLNCNADTAAGETAAALHAEKFVCISDTHGIRSDPNDPDSFIPNITADQIHHRIEDGTISEGMLPKVEACLRALDGGVRRAHIIDGGLPHSLLLEIFSDRGVGTLITSETESAGQS